MGTDVLLKVENVSKRFARSLKRALWYGVCDLAGEMVGRSGDRTGLRPSEFWAADDISFEVRRGECLGLIGPNGAGKSTLLKLLNGLIKPDRGRITVRGRVGALIALGAGFNPILTGRENLYINAAVYGIGKREIDRLFDEIVAFAEIEDFIDMPVQSYSSGMKVRLGFAVATRLDPDVLLIDEVLAVGDAGFRAKCYNRIAQIAETTAVVFVSHAMPHVARLANRTIVLHHGREAFLGPTAEAINRYYALFDSNDEWTRAGSGETRIEALRILDSRGNEVTKLDYSEAASIEVDVVAHVPLDSVVVDLTFFNIGGEMVAECNNFVVPRTISLEKGQRATITMAVEQMTLNPGVYKIGALLMSKDMIHHYDWIQQACSLEIGGARPAAAPHQILAGWHVESKKGISPVRRSDPEDEIAPIGLASFPRRKAV